MKKLFLGLAALAFCFANVSCSSCCSKKGKASCCSQQQGEGCSS